MAAGARHWERASTVGYPVLNLPSCDIRKNSCSGTFRRCRYRCRCCTRLAICRTRCCTLVVSRVKMSLWRVCQRHFHALSAAFLSLLVFVPFLLVSLFSLLALFDFFFFIFFFVVRPVPSSLPFLLSAIPPTVHVINQPISGF